MKWLGATWNAVARFRIANHPGTGDTPARSFSKVIGSGYAGTDSSIDRQFHRDRTGELGDPIEAGRFLNDTIELMVRRGERRRLMLANMAITAYQQFRRQRLTPPVLASA